ncbi:MAG: ATP-grasp domain-containing protein [Candidatus Heimdallarchaeota archaeon]|nr:ATP-grasp domain-containing protein [Candidatus Heimdallarchaeota archaeon]
MKLLIVGFNARPLAKAAMLAGHEVGVIDYFGDIDLLNLTKNCFTVLDQKPNEKLHRPLLRKPAEYLYYLTEIMVDEQGDFDGILLGSAFDRYPEIVEKFSLLGPKLYANEVKKFDLIRNRENINAIAKKSGFYIPIIKKIVNLIDLKKGIEDFTFPVITRRDGGGGGAGIRLWHSKKDLIEHFSVHETNFDKELWIQEYIDGIDASASVICMAEKVQLLSINRQLIGDRKLKAPSDFAYCGNVVPLDEQKYMNDKQFMRKIIKNIKCLFSELKLMGSNGIDFVLKDEKIYFMEINPRFQGSIECVQYATGLNIVSLHLDTFNGILHNLPEEPKYKRYGFKGILFSNLEKPFSVRAYPKSRWIVDRTQYYTLLEKNDPFCSIVLPVKKIQKGYAQIYTLAKKIIEMNQE